MKTFLATLCALACVFGASSTVHATELSSDAQVQTSADIDRVLNELSLQQVAKPNLLQQFSEPSALAGNSVLVDMGLGNDPLQAINLKDDVLSHLTLVASNSVDRFRQSGRSSWYGAQLQGRKTASGERFDMHDMTAAHPSLPFDSYVKVTNQRNDKSVVVKINDRGPFHGNRIIDLSYAAAKEIGMASHGIGNVAVIKVSAP